MRICELRSLAARIFLVVSTFGCGAGFGQSVAAPLQASRTLPRAGQTIVQSATLQETNLYVAPAGSDLSGNGTASKPYRTINRALLEIPDFVTQHYIINLAAGTYREKVDVSGRSFGTAITPSLKAASIELKGDPTAPDSYVISGADAPAPATPVRSYAVQSTFANFILNGVSLQYGIDAGFLQRGGNAVINACTFRHFTGAGAFALWTRQGAQTDLRGNNTISDVTNGVEVDSLAFMGTFPTAWNHGLTELFGTGFPPFPETTLTVTGVTSGIALQAGENSVIDMRSVSLSGTSVVGSVGIEAWIGGFIVVVTATISNFDIGIHGISSGQIYVDTPILSNLATGVKLTDRSLVDWFTNDPVFTSVTTQYSISDDSSVVGRSTHLFGGTLNSTGAVAINAGGTNENVTLTPSGTGSIVLNGLVGIGGPSSGAKLMISGAGGSQTYVNVKDTDAHKDTLIKLDTEGNSDDSFFLKAGVDGNDKWWVKADGSAFSTSFSTALNVVLFSPNPTFDISLGNTQKIILSGDVTGSNLLNALPGEYLFFIVCQDPNGGHKFTWPPNFKGAMNIGGQDMIGNIIGVAPLACAAQSFVYDGTNAYALSPGVFNM